MGIKDLAKKVMRRGEESEDELFGDIDDEFEDDLDGPTSVSKEGAEEDPFGEDETSASSELKEKPPKPKTIYEKPTPSEDASGSLQELAEQVRLLDSKINQIQSNQELQKTELDRCIQFLSLINEKTDHLEREHSELERLIQER